LGDGFDLLGISADPATVDYVTEIFELISTEMARIQLKASIAFDERPLGSGVSDRGRS